MIPKKPLNVTQIDNLVIASSIPDNNEQIASANMPVEFTMSLL